jgi:hypothetical protein
MALFWMAYAMIALTLDIFPALPGGLHMPFQLHILEANSD